MLLGMPATGCVIRARCGSQGSTYGIGLEYSRRGARVFARRFVAAEGEGGGR